MIMHINSIIYHYFLTTISFDDLSLASLVTPALMPLNINKTLMTMPVS